MTTARPRAAINARYSTDLQNANSIRDQIAKCAEKAAREGWDVVEEFSDAAMSGSRNDRPGYQTLYNQLPSRLFEAYGYRVAEGPHGERLVGELVIDEDEARIVRRIFGEYANGRSPQHIAAAHNADGVPAPRHKDKGGAGSGHWKQNTINGNKQRATGILNNELYVGRRVWNRLVYGKDPISRTRVSRIRPQDEWVFHATPELRILSEDLWMEAKRRQDAQRPQRQARWTGDPNRLSGSQALRRPKYLLSGLLECGTCGGKLTTAGGGRHRRYYCANNKEKGASVCRGMPGLRQADAEELVLSGFRRQLMLPKAYEKFRADFVRHVQARGKELAADQKFRLAELAELEAQQANLVRAVAQGHALGALVAALSEVESKIAAAKAKIEVGRPRPMAMPENLPALYRAHIENLVSTLTKDEIVGRVAEELRGMIDHLVVRHEPELGTHTIEIFGRLAAMLAGADNKNAAAYSAAARSLKLVAGVGFEPTTFRL